METSQYFLFNKINWEVKIFSVCFLIMNACLKKLLLICWIISVLCRFTGMQMNNEKSAIKANNNYSYWPEALNETEESLKKQISYSTTFLSILR